MGTIQLLHIHFECPRLNNQLFRALVCPSYLQILNSSANCTIGRLGFLRDLFDNIYDHQNNTPLYDKNEYWLHCHSRFLVEEHPADTARDFNGKDIVDKNKNPVPIKDLPKYKTELRKFPEMKPWWPDAVPDLNGYYFDDEGGDFCDDPEHMGATAKIQRMRQLPRGSAAPVTNDRRASMIICPQAFDNTVAPDSYIAANRKIKANTRVSLHEVVPKSATLLHESMHAIFGETMLSGKAEQCEL